MAKITAQPKTLLKDGTAKVGGILLLLLATFIFSLFLWQNREVYLGSFDPYRLGALYQQSQFSPQLKHRTFTILDEDLYAFAGWHYLTTGDIGTINIEHPPLGKYFIGLSIKLFGNQNIGQIFWGILFLFVAFILSRRLSRSFFLAATIPLLIIFEPLYRYQLTHSLLDLPQSVFVLLYLWAFGSHQQPLAKTVIAGISLGAVATIKFPALAIILVAASIFGTLLARVNFIYRLKHLCLILFLAGVVFTLTYIPYLVGHNLKQWFDLLVGASKIHLSHVPEYPKGVVLEVLFLNHWPKWWAKGWQIVEEWQYTWPFWGFGMLASPLLARKEIFKENVVIFLFAWFYFLFLASRLFFPTYLLPILPLGFLFLLLLPTLLRRN